MREQDLKQAISDSLSRFASGNLAENACALFETLGYRVDKRTSLESPTAQSFIESFAQGKSFKPEDALVDDWQFVDLMFQLTREEITGSTQLRISFGDSSKVDNTIIESYLFFAIALSGSTYTRSELAAITREVNKLFPMPVMLVFQHGQTLTLSIINRRLNKRDESRDVLEKVTLIKDITFAGPHRAHIEILFDLSLTQLYKAYKFTNFVELHQAWQKTLDSSELNKRFFREVSNWYFWATKNVVFPAGAEADEEVRNATSVIRLITRLFFVWFLKEKSSGDRPLVPDELFRRSSISQLIHFDDPNSSTYYKAILQNLFFATLNQPMNTSKEQENRKFRHKGKSGQRDQHYMVHNVYRYENLFKQPEEALKLFEQIPFLNGGLFECLDHPDPDNPKNIIRVDGFSDREDNILSVPNYLFFSEGREVDLNEIYGTKNKRFTVRGLIDIFNSYKFTITENTPIEEEIALDPELLGKVFENLLASYNSETQVTARKQTGSFYTPRGVVDYMVGESLLVHLATAMMESGLVNEGDRANLEERLRQLLDYQSKLNPFDGHPEETAILIQSIDRLKVLDPAVGSGAFPMGILQKLVFILSKLDRNNQLWKHQQREREILAAMRDIDTAKQINYEEAREVAIQKIQQRLDEIELDFANNNEADYPRKLFLIENSIYGVDIQPIAVQIAKLRFFISLIVEQRVKEEAANRGILPLPNLETKFIAANTLVQVDKQDKFGQTQLAIRDPRIEQLEAHLKEVRHKVFAARTPKKKQEYRDRDRQLREGLAELLKAEGLSGETAAKLAHWNPYDQNASAPFFDLEWMFGIKNGFDVVIGNPPYVRQEKIKELKPVFKQQYQSYTGVADLYVYFYERGFQLLKEGGVLSYISSNKWFRANYGSPLRQHIAKNYSILTITDFGELSVFEAATFPMIFIASKRKVSYQSPVFTQVKSLTHPYPDVQALINQSGKILPTSAIQNAEWMLTDSSSADILKRIEEVGVPLGEYASGQIYYGIKTGFNKAFVINSAKRSELISQDSKNAEIIKPLAIGDDVRRWSTNQSDNWLLFIPWHFPLNDDPSIEGASQVAEQKFIECYPFIHSHLLQYKRELSARNKAETGIRYEWYALQRCAASYWEQLEKPKIMYPVIAKEPRFAFDTTGAFTNDKVFIIPVNDLYLLGILNSTIAWHYLKGVCSVLGDADKGGRLELRSIYMSKVPIFPASDKDKNLIKTFVSYVLHLAGKFKGYPGQSKNLMQTADDMQMLNYFEQIINGLVYELYLSSEVQTHGLTFAESLYQESLPSLDTVQGSKIDALWSVFQRLHATDHLIRQNLFALDTLPIIRLIEGRA